MQLRRRGCDVSYTEMRDLYVSLSVCLSVGGWVGGWVIRCVASRWVGGQVGPGR